MSLDWITVAAQIVNFLVLVWLLQRFLYGPITLAMAQREAALQKRVDDTTEAKRHAEAEAQRLEEERTNLHARHDELIARACSEADTLKAQLEKEIRTEMDDRRQVWLQDIEAEREEFLAELRRNATAHFHRLAREALEGLSGKTLNDAMAERFADRLSELAPEQQDRLATTARRARGPIIVESTFDLSASSRRRITTAVHQQISKDAEIEYIISDELICGLRLRVDGQVLAWSLDTYLDRMEHDARRIFDEDAAR